MEHKNTIEKYCYVKKERKNLRVTNFRFENTKKKLEKKRMNISKQFIKGLLSY